MSKFLQKTARYIKSTFKGDLDSICVVLPNRRAGLFLRKYLASEVGKAAWAPVILSIEDFITGISGLNEVDQLTLIFELYKVHCKIEAEKAQSFDEFLHWAPQIITDFNEIDRYLADPSDLFSTLSEARAISLWNLDGRPLTDFELNYLRFYQSLVIYYKEFIAELLSKHMGYQGLIFRSVAENIESVKDNLAWKHVVFAGFNAFTLSEEKIVDTLRNNGLATLLWDADRYFLDDEKQEAGDFLRTWLKKWPVSQPRWISDELSVDRKEIEIIGSADAIGQVKYCGKLLRDLAIDGKATVDTAVVLLDMGLLMPLLSSIPEEVTSLNITAGLPLKQTPLAGFIDTVFNLHINASRFSGGSAGKSPLFYYKDVLKLLQHPYTQIMAGEVAQGNRVAVAEAIEKTRCGQKALVNYQDISGDQTGLFSVDLSFIEPLFNRWNSPADALNALKICLENLRKALLKISNKTTSGEAFDDPAGRSSVELEYVFTFSGILHQLTELVNVFSGNIKIPVLYELFKQISAGVSIPFYGEPLAGVQIMGMLETRTLDFENLIILSCNDDLLPSSKINTSFIPFDIKRSFNLPTYRYKDSVYAYHFYRLIQRAKKIWILYNSEPGQMGGGDKSRFLRQIELELPVQNPGISIRNSVLTTPVLNFSPPKVIEVPKNSSVANSLEAKALKGFSASSLNKYRNCPLKFYYSEIAAIREPDEITDLIDPAILGNAVHAALFELYKPLKNSLLTTESLNIIRQMADHAVIQAFDKKFKGSSGLSGKNLLLINVAKLLVNKLIKFDIDCLANDSNSNSVSVAMLEQEIVTTRTIQYTGKEFSVNLKGFIDRVDNLDGTWRIVDYKTGTTDSRNIKVKDWDNLLDNPELNIGFQLLMYAHLINSITGNHSPITAGIISLRKISAGYSLVSVPAEEQEKTTTLITETSLVKFGSLIDQILSDIYDLTKPFVQTGNLKVCQQCPYINICGR